MSAAIIISCVISTSREFISLVMDVFKSKKAIVFSNIFRIYKPSLFSFLWSYLIIKIYTHGKVTAMEEMFGYIPI